MSKSNPNGTIKRSDIIMVGSHKYVVHKITRKTVELLPIDLLLETDKKIDLVPKLVMPIENIPEYTKVDSHELLCLLNQKNPLIIEALRYYLENETD